MESKSRQRKGRKAPACPAIGALMRYGERTVRVIAEASGQRVIIESVDDDGRTSLFQFRCEPETTGDRQCEASRSVVDRKSISVAGEGSVMSIIGTRRAAARQAEGKVRGESVGNGGTA
jgi:hypothetical protein